MSYLLPKLATKSEIDEVIKATEDIVLVLRFGRDDDGACLQLDNIVSTAKDWAINGLSSSADVHPTG